MRRRRLGRTALAVGSVTLGCVAGFGTMLGLTAYHYGEDGTGTRILLGSLTLVVVAFSLALTRIDWDD